MVSKSWTSNLVAGYLTVLCGSGLHPVVSPDVRKLAFGRPSQGLWVAFLEKGGSP